MGRAFALLHGGPSQAMHRIAVGKKPATDSTRVHKLCAARRRGDRVMLRRKVVVTTGLVPRDQAMHLLQPLGMTVQYFSVRQASEISDVLQQIAATRAEVLMVTNPGVTEPRWREITSFAIQASERAAASQRGDRMNAALHAAGAKDERGNFDATQETSSARTTRGPCRLCRRTALRRHVCP